MLGFYFPLLLFQVCCSFRIICRFPQLVLGSPGSHWPSVGCYAWPACTQECECAFWHFKKPCGGNVKSPCVRVCSPSCSLGRQCVPCHCASKHTQLPEEKAGPLSPSPSVPARQSIPSQPTRIPSPPPLQSLSDKVAGRLVLSSCQYLQSTLRWHWCGWPWPAEKAGVCINQM